jgi:hypothetical protein
MKWKGDEVNEYFFKLYEKQDPERYLRKPDHEAFQNLYDVELALKDFYISCAKNAWSKEKLVSSLDLILNSNFANNKANNPGKYLEILHEEASKLKNEILENLFNPTSA